MGAMALETETESLWLEAEEEGEERKPGGEGRKQLGPASELTTTTQKLSGRIFLLLLNHLRCLCCHGHLEIAIDGCP